MALLRPVPPSLAALAVLVLLAAPQLDLRASIIDPVATAAGLRARVGPLDDWTIVVRDAAALDAVEVSLRSPDGRSLERQIALTGASHEDRSRELAASLALVIEQWDDPPRPDEAPVDPATDPAADPSVPPKQPAAPVRGWLMIGPRLELKRGYGEAGADLQGGAWLLREHLQPLASVGWSLATDGRLSLHSVRFGAGLAVGAPLARGRLWLGGHGLAHAAWMRAHEGRSETLWGVSQEFGGLLQVRGRRWLLGVRTGVDVAVPRLTATGRDTRLVRGPVQWMLGIGFGVVFG